MSIIGRNIADRRKALGMTQEELATKMGYKSKSTINKIELGVNDIVQSKVSQFAKVLKTTPSYLMGWETEEKKTTEYDGLSEGEKELLDLFNRVPEDAQAMVLEMIRVAVSKL
jgi:transcriptional regulator with XRE-family HTH domain